MSGLQLLIVEDEAKNLDSLVAIAESAGFQVTACSGSEIAEQYIRQKNFDAIISDLHTQGKGELHLLKLAKTQNSSTLVVIITDSDSVERAVEAVDMGAYRYITKPYELERIRLLIKQVREQCLLRAELIELRSMVEDSRKSKIIGKSPAIQEVKEFIQKISPLDCALLLEGETGVGKEFFARLAHENSTRADKGFFAVNCGSFAEGLLSNELFGHEKDAFTGAGQRKAGIFEAAAGGTLFLDEISEMSLSSQVKLLRVLQEGVFLRVGGTQEVVADVRIIAAANRNLQDEVVAGRFRKDLLYRLNIIRITIPPLRERVEDISLFCKFFIAKFAEKYRKNIDAISDEVMSILYEYQYPGNVRELINIIERAVILAESNCIERKQLPKRILKKIIHAEPVENTLCSLAEIQEQHIHKVLEHVGGNKTQAAKILGVDRITLWRKLKKDK